eukprot:2992665-Rhodomonas_salina.1
MINMIYHKGIWQLPVLTLEKGLPLQHQCRNEWHSRQQPMPSSPGPDNGNRASQRIYDASRYGASDRRQPMHHATPT